MKEILVRIIVTGATGTVGRHVIDGLLAHGATVRAMTRRPDTAGLPPQVDVVAADLDDPTTLPPAFVDGDALYLLATGDTSAAIAAAEAAGIRRIVLLSSASAGFADDDAGGAFHRSAEDAVTSSGLQWTLLRPGMFAANLLDWADAIKEHGVVRAPYDRALQAPVDERDVAEIAVNALLYDGHASAIHTLTGPQALSKSEQVAAIATGAGRSIEFVELTPAEWRDEASASMPGYAIDWLLAYWAKTADAPETADPTLGRLLGRAPATVDEWAERHREAFR
jgi:uncharacterized protein YbjT (DUF2867 family)